MGEPSGKVEEMQTYHIIGGEFNSSNPFDLLTTVESTNRARLSQDGRVSAFEGLSVNRLVSATYRLRGLIKNVLNPNGVQVLSR